MESVDHSQTFRTLHLSVLTGLVALGILAQGVASAISAADTRQAAAIMGSCAALNVLSVVLRRRWGPFLPAKIVLMLAFQATTMGLIYLNGGLFNTELDPILFNFAFVAVVGLDGTLSAMLAGIFFGWFYMVAGKFFLPDIYHGPHADISWARVGSHMVWWGLALIVSFILGRGVYRIIDELGRSRDALRIAQAKEQMLAEAAERLRDQAAAARQETLNVISSTFEARMQRAVEIVLGVSRLICEEASSASVAAATAEKESGAVTTLAQAASGLTQTVAMAAAALAKGASEVCQQSTKAASATADAVEQVRQSHTALDAMGVNASRIQTVVGLIDAIARQTNLLALNATIEASRAGETGRGFAVVASEVKRLASQTSRATSEVAAMVAGMQAAMAEMVQASQTVQQSVGTAHGLARAISNAMAGQSAATTAIARTADTVAADTWTTSERTLKVAGHAGQTAQTARQLFTGADELDRETKALQAEADAFVLQLRAV